MSKKLKILIKEEKSIDENALPDALKKALSDRGIEMPDSLSALKNIISSFNLFGGDEEEEESQDDNIKADTSGDLSLSPSQLKDKFKGYKGEETGFRGYVHFLWDQFDKNKDSSLVSGWTKQKTAALVQRLAPKYDLDPLIVMAVMSGESGGMPVGVYGQTRSREGSPSKAISANSTAYGSGQITLPTYEYIKDKIGVPHYMLWNPNYGIEATIAVIKLKIDKRGSLERGMAAYAGSAAGGRRKMNAIRKAFANAGRKVPA